MLTELVFTAAILLVLAGSAFESLAQRPAQLHSTVVRFAALVAEARALAAVSGTETGGGASIGVERVGDVYVATLFTYRPALGAAAVPVREAAEPLSSATAIALGAGGAARQTPFALFFSPSGHASARAGYRIGTTAPLAAEPVCPLDTGIVIEFSDATQSQARAISCEMAQLDPNDEPPAMQATAAPPRRMP